MKPQKPVILIGPTCDDPAESVSSVNLAFGEGLKDRFTFVCSACNRRHGLTRQTQLNFWNLYYLVKHVLIWCKNLIQHRPDIAHYTITSSWAMGKGFLMLGLARICGARTVGHLHDGGFVDNWQRLSPLYRRIAHAQLSKLDGFVMPSESWCDLMAEQVGLSREKLHVVNNPIGAGFEDASLAMAVERPGNRVLSLGTMGRAKGVFDLVASCAVVAEQTRDFSLDLVGQEREPGVREQVIRQLLDLDLTTQVSLLGSVPGNVKLDLFRDASIFVLPSYFENFPLVILEAAAAGHAIITTRVGAVPEFFDDDVSAIFVDIGNVKQLAEAISRLLQQPEERRRLGSAAREVFKSRLARSRIMKSLDQVYSHVLRLQ